MSGVWPQYLSQKLGTWGTWGVASSLRRRLSWDANTFRRDAQSPTPPRDWDWWKRLLRTTDLNNSGWDNQFCRLFSPQNKSFADFIFSPEDLENVYLLDTLQYCWKLLLTFNPNTLIRRPNTLLYFFLIKYVLFTLIFIRFFFLALCCFLGKRCLIFEAITPLYLRFFLRCFSARGEKNEINCKFQLRLFFLSRWVWTFRKVLRCSFLSIKDVDFLLLNR